MSQWPARASSQLLLGNAPYTLLHVLGLGVYFPPRQYAQPLSTEAVVQHGVLRDDIFSQWDAFLSLHLTLSFL